MIGHIYDCFDTFYKSVLDDLMVTLGYKGSFSEIFLLSTELYSSKK